MFPRVFTLLSSCSIVKACRTPPSGCPLSPWCSLLQDNCFPLQFPSYQTMGQRTALSIHFFCTCFLRKTSQEKELLGLNINMFKAFNKHLLPALLTSFYSASVSQQRRNASKPSPEPLPRYTRWNPGRPGLFLRMISPHCNLGPLAGQSPGPGKGYLGHGQAEFCIPRGCPWPLSLPWYLTHGQGHHFSQPPLE